MSAHQSGVRSPDFKLAPVDTVQVLLAAPRSPPGFARLPEQDCPSCCMVAGPTRAATDKGGASAIQERLAREASVTWVLGYLEARVSTDLSSCECSTHWNSSVREPPTPQVLRKLRLAAEGAEEKEDRDIVCSEVFADITGDLNSAARGACAGGAHVGRGGAGGAGGAGRRGWRLGGWCLAGQVRRRRTVVHTAPRASQTYTTSQQAALWPGCREHWDHLHKVVRGVGPILLQGGCAGGRGRAAVGSHFLPLPGCEDSCSKQKTHASPHEAAN